MAISKTIKHKIDVKSVLDTQAFLEVHLTEKLAHRKN